MKLSKYLLDKIYYILSFVCIYFFVILLQIAYKVQSEAIITQAVIIIGATLFFLTIDYLKRKKFYNTMFSNLQNLDKKYLVLETVDKPSLYEEELVCEILYEANKSMIEEVKEYKLSIDDFKEYIEMWIHEVKIPIASLVLAMHNNNIFDENAIIQIDKIDRYIEQVLYYVRSENAEKDYYINKIKLSKIVSEVALKNKNDILNSNINLDVSNVNVDVLTDSKWLGFILNQIISNSIKYADENKDEKYIKIYSSEEKNKIVLTIIDNGIGIKKSEVKRVFEKSFTGTNGRMFSKATGMGLYISKNLCEKLGHRISVESEEKEYTKIDIEFAKEDFYDVIR